MNVNASAPGRICLFGEHQDYLGLPVVAAAVDVRCQVRSQSREDRIVHLELLDIGEVFSWDLDALPAPGSRGYWLSALHVASREGWLPKTGWNAQVTSDIPQQAGASSSTALVVAWCGMIAVRSGLDVTPRWVAEAAHRAEVQWFNEPGGMMDHYACALGGVRRFEFAPSFCEISLPKPTGTWILIDSGEPKNTLGVLGRAKHQRLDLMEHWDTTWSLDSGKALPPLPVSFSLDQSALMEGTVAIRDVSEFGYQGLRDFADEPLQWAPLLTHHHDLLRDVLHVSTDRIDRILMAALDAGAWGGKINGSGGGGTCFVVTESSMVQDVNSAVESKGGRPMVVELGEDGVTIEQD